MEAKADQLVHEAEAALKKGGGFFSSVFGGGTERFEEPAEKFQRAGHAYKASKNWAAAASAYERSADCFKKAKNDGDTANCFIEAARCHIKAGNAPTAMNLIDNEALPRMVDAGRLSQAAKLHQELAEMMEEGEMFEEAMVNFQKAADFFIAENAASTAAKCSGKIAFLAARTDPPDYERAAAEFEKVGRDSLSSNLLKFGAKGNFFNAVICLLARGDIVAGESALGRFKEMDYTFGGSRECKLLDDVCAAFKDGNMDAFTDAVFNFDQISKLDPWRTTILLKIKNEMSKASGESGDLT